MGLPKKKFNLDLGVCVAVTIACHLFPLVRRLQMPQ